MKPLAHKNRLNGKKGYVYLLQSKSSPDTFKFGCTRYTPEERCKSVNKRSFVNDFEVLTCFESKSIFRDETEVKYLVWDSYQIPEGEIFQCDDDLQEKIFSHYRNKGAEL